MVAAAAAVAITAVAVTAVAVAAATTAAAAVADRTAKIQAIWGVDEVCAPFSYIDYSFFTITIELKLKI